MNIDELYNSNIISLRTVNVCKKNKLLCEEKIIEFYLKFNTFIYLTNISEENNIELIDFCENHFKKNNLNINEFNLNILNIYFNLNTLEKENFEKQYNYLISNLSFKCITFFNTNNIILNINEVINFIFKSNIFKQKIKSKKVLKELFDLRISIIIYLKSI